MTEGQLTQRRPALGGAVVSRERLSVLARDHAALVVLIAAAAALRVVALVAIYPGIWFSDTNSYVAMAATGVPSMVRVGGYALVVAPFLQIGSAGALIVAQHLLGLAIAVLLYALLLRRGVSKTLALVAALPAALDPYLINIEHMIMSETVFHAALAGAFAAVMWSERLATREAAIGGLLLGYASVVRSVAVPFIVLFAIYLVVRRVGLVRLVAFAAGWALVVGGYATVYKVHHGEFALTSWGSRFLYAKVAPYTDCSEIPDLPANERAICPDPEHRLTPNGYLWNEGTPIKQVPVSEDATIRSFGLRVIANDPAHYVRVVAGDFLHYFEPGHRKGPGDYNVTTWQFPRDPRVYDYPGYRGPIRPGSVTRERRIDPGKWVTREFTGEPTMSVTASRFLHYYGRYLYTSGQIFTICVALVLLAAVWRPRRNWRQRLDAGLLAACVICSLVLVAALSIFDYRYALIAIVFLPPAAVLAVTGLRTGDELGRDGDPVAR
ncbi:MAG: hypothetical protein KY396_06225 [Actinobacteria bacterium]|nr:hypothetical protein [Actinomycetota bacterium]